MKLDEQNKSVFSGVMLGYVVLVLHILLMVGLGVAVVLIKGIYDFRWLVFIAGIALIGGSGYYFYRRMKESNRKLSDFMNDPAFQDRTLEISLLGGMATVKLGHRDDNIQLISAQDQPKQLEAPQSAQVKELSTLNDMLEKGLITREEFLKLKKDIL
ncbi:MAG: SHOCT domain-containing protein [Desulfuromonadales bacterium]|nr:SHOCT domain-containing protein [Desulfuromonadales bacterium]